MSTPSMRTEVAAAPPVRTTVGTRRAPSSSIMRASRPCDRGDVAEHGAGLDGLDRVAADGVGRQARRHGRQQRGVTAPATGCRGRRPAGWRRPRTSPCASTTSMVVAVPTVDHDDRAHRQVSRAAHAPSSRSEPTRSGSGMRDRRWGWTRRPPRRGAARARRTARWIAARPARHDAHHRDRSVPPMAARHASGSSGSGGDAGDIGRRTPPATRATLMALLPTSMAMTMTR